MEDNLYFIGIKNYLCELAENVGIISSLSGESHLGYFGFWDNVCIIEFHKNDGSYTVKHFDVAGPQYAECKNDKELLDYTKDQNIQFVYEENPLGKIFRSYTMAHLELVRWAADVAYTRDFYNGLLEG